MFRCINFLVIVVFLCAGFAAGETNDCVEQVYSDNSSDLRYKCREGCEGIAPKCVPSCQGDCPVHSTCTRPNYCECDPGYTIDELYPDIVPNLKSCKSVCDEKCPTNSHCAGYNICKCNDGFSDNSVNLNGTQSVRNFNIICDPICPSRSHYVGPNECECDDGYVADEVDENVVPHLQSCKLEHNTEGLTALQIVIYSLLALCGVCLLIAGTCMILILLKNRKPVVHKRESWFSITENV